MCSNLLRRVFAVGAILPIVAASSGCPAVGHNSVDIPEFRLHGQIVDTEGSPVSGQSVKIIVPTAYYFDDEAKAVALRIPPESVGLRPLSDPSLEISLTSDEHGEFEHVFPAHMRWVGFGLILPIPLRIGGGEGKVRHIYLITCGHTTERKVYWLWNRGASVRLRRVGPGMKDVHGLRSVNGQKEASVIAKRDGDRVDVEVKLVQGFSE